MHKTIKLCGMAIMLVSGVSVLTTVQAKPDHAMKFTWSNAYLSYLKKRSNYNYKNNMKKLTEMFYPSVYRKYKNNEFQLRGKEKNSESKVKTKVKNLEKPLIFKINTSSKFGKYNFNKKDFPFHPFGKNTYFHQNGCQSYGSCHEIDLIFSNPNLIQKIKMSKKSAKNLVDSRTESDGNINRNINLTLRIKITGVKNKNNSPTRHPSLIGKIVKATAYAGKGGSHKIQTWSG